MTTGYDWSCITCRAIGNEIKDLKTLILKLQDDIHNLKTLNQNADHSTNHTLFDDIVAEVEDRAKRKCNLIIFGVEEQNQNLQSVERTEVDKKEISGILQVVKSNINVNDITPIRLGRYISGKKRPIRIRLPHEQQVHEIIRNAKNLRNSKYNKIISLSFDRTTRQQEMYKKVRTELRERLDSGEKDLKIQYVNNKPVVVTKN